MTFDLVVQGGTVVTPTSVEKLDVAVTGGTIAALGAPGSFAAQGAKRTIDATGCFVVPGGVDPHVHYDMGFAAVRSEDRKYSVAPAWGGTTTVIDQVFHEGDASLVQTVEERKASAAGTMAVDYSFHALLSANPSFEVIDEIGEVIRGGIPTIKCLTTYGWMSDDGHIWGVYNEVAKQGGLAIAHAEDDAIANWLTAKHLREGKTHGAHIVDTRGPLVEEAAVRRLALLAERSGCPLYFFHVGAGSAAAAIGEYRRRGVPIYGESLIAYLSFTADKLWDDENRGLLWNNYPVVKHQADQDRLWRAVLADELQAVSSDHFCTTAETRYKDMGTRVDNLQAGQAAVEMRLPVLWSRGVAEGRLGLRRFVELSSANAAKIMGLYPRKGALQVGSDADITVIDPSASWTVRWQEHHMVADYNCWEGEELKGRVKATVLRGETLVLDGSWVGPTQSGQFLARTLDPTITGPSADLWQTRESAGIPD